MSTDDDDDDDDLHFTSNPLLARSTQASPATKIPSHPSLSRSCFAAISSWSSQKVNSSDDLTELKWLTTFKFKDHLIDSPLQETACESSEPSPAHGDRIGKLIHQLKAYDPEQLGTDHSSFGPAIFLALYSKRDDRQSPWSLSIKQIYDFIHAHMKNLTQRCAWKHSIRQTLLVTPCFVKTNVDVLKSRSSWTIDTYYRPSLIRAYTSNALLSSQEAPVEPPTSERDEDKSSASPSTTNHFAPKATVKTKALSRLYERLCEEKSSDQLRSESERKRPRSTSSLERRPPTQGNDERCASLSSSWTQPKSDKRSRTRDHSRLNTSQKSSTTVPTPSPRLPPNSKLDSSTSQLIDRHKTFTSKKPPPSSPMECNDSPTDDERDSGSTVHPARKSIITTRAQTAARASQHSTIIHRRKSASPRKCLSLPSASHRANTRISRRIIEHDLKLLRQANGAPLDLTVDPPSSTPKSTRNTLQKSTATPDRNPSR